MRGIFPRPQAARLAALLGRQFVPGLTLLDAPPRRGKSDLLRQLFGALLQQRAVAPVLLTLGGRRLPENAAEQVTSQLLAFAEQRLTSPLAPLDRDRLAERDDFATWQDFLTACGGSPAPERFFAGVARLAETAGPICLLLDDAPNECLRAAVAAASPNVAVLATGGWTQVREATQVLPLEELTVREGVLLAEGLARALGVEFAGAAAEPFVAYCGADPWVLQAVVRRAATSGVALIDSAALVRVYTDELAQGTLAAYFRDAMPGEPGSPQRIFALETLSAGTIEAARVAIGRRWRHRIPVEEVLDQMRRSGLAVRSWPAARDWATLEASGTKRERARGQLTLRLLSDLEAAARAHAEQQVAARIAAGLGALTPAATAWLAENGVASAQVPEVCHVTREEIAGGDLYLCYGFAEGRRQPGSAALLAVAVAENQRLPQVLDEMNRHATAAQPETGNGPAQLEKWLVLKNPGLPELDLARRAGVKLLELELFNRLLSSVPEAAPVQAPPSDVVLKLPMNADYEIAAVRVLDHLLERHNCEKRAAAQARIALVEACLNAIEHGRAAKLDPATAQMEVRLSVTTESLEVVVTNPGPPFQPDDREPPTGSGLHRGHGLKIIRSLMDRVSFSSDLNGTSLRMSKRFSASGVPAGPAPESVGLERLKDEKTATGSKRN